MTRYRAVSPHAVREDSWIQMFSAEPSRRSSDAELEAVPGTGVLEGTTFKNDANSDKCVAA